MAYSGEPRKWWLEESLKTSAVFAILTLIFVVFGSFMHWIFFEEKPEPTVQAQDEWCEVGQVMSDGSVIYHGDSGITDLIAVTTVDGPKLMAKCNQF